MWVEEQVVGERGVVGNTEEGHEPGDDDDGDSDDDDIGYVYKSDLSSF